MRREPVFYSFHYGNDVFRTQQVRNIGVVDGNASVSANEWEQLKRSGEAAVERWIDDNMKYRRCVIVLIGSETANRKWVRHEIAKAWNDRRGLFGIHVHNLKCPRTGTCARGPNPFDCVTVSGQPMSRWIPTHEPSSWDAYGDIARSIEGWVAGAIASAEHR
jgi:hypothetical protein